jgi:two-component system chemotaxis response regulator CheY
MRALIIDDSRAVRAIIGGMLRENGWETVEAANGQEGLDQLDRTADIELILVDWNMPVMDGLEFIKTVRAQPAYDAVPIVMVTTEAEHTQVVRAMQAGANEYVMKPFTKEILAAKLSLLDAFKE